MVFGQLAMRRDRLRAGKERVNRHSTKPCKWKSPGLATWCQAHRYCASMTENVPRLDLSGQAVGGVAAAQARHAKRQAEWQDGQARRHQSKPKA